jgi:hypothetical protein
LPEASNFLFHPARAGWLTASIGWSGAAATWVPYLIGSWNVNQAANFLSDISSAVWRARGTYLTTKTNASGIADADDTRLVAVGSAGSGTAHAIILVNETGASQTSYLGAHIGTCAGLPFLPNGGDIDIEWDSGAAKIFQL